MADVSLFIYPWHSDFSFAAGNPQYLSNIRQIRTHLSIESGSDYLDLVEISGIEPLTYTPKCIATRCSVFQASVEKIGKKISMFYAQLALARYAKNIEKRTCFSHTREVQE